MLSDGYELVQLVREHFESDELQRIFDYSTNETRIILGLRKLVVSIKRNNIKPLKFFRIDVISGLTNHILDFTYASPSTFGVEEAFEFEVQEAKGLNLFGLNDASCPSEARKTLRRE